MMKRLLLAAVLALAPGCAWAMSQSQIPSKFNIPWGNSAGAPYIRAIPQSSQIGIENCAASLTDGFPPLTFVPQASGGCPPFGKDFNGILKQVTQWNQWSAFGPIPYDGTFSAAIGGYPKGAVVQSNLLLGRLWFSTADNNTADPDSTTATNWIVLPGTAQPGTPTLAFQTTRLPNNVLANGATIGNGSSNATNRANADTYWLFVYLWTNCAGTTCPVFTSAGGASSKGASALADWNANKAIATPDMRGSGVFGNDDITTTRLNGVPIIFGSYTVPLSIVGENTHTLTLGETPAGISSSVSVAVSTTVTGTATVAAGGNPLLASNGVVISGLQGSGAPFDGVQAGTGSLVHPTSTGSISGSGSGSGSGSATSNNTGGGAHNNVPRTFLGYWNLAL